MENIYFPPRETRVKMDECENKNIEIFFYVLFREAIHYNVNISRNLTTKIYICGSFAQCLFVSSPREGGTIFLCLSVGRTAEASRSGNRGSMTRYRRTERHGENVVDALT